MPAPKNLVHETSTSTGTGNLIVAAVNGKVRFSNATYGFGTGGTNVFNYFASSRTHPEWERGTGHMLDTNTLVRDTVIESSNVNVAVNFSAGLIDITNDVPAAEQGVLTPSSGLLKYLSATALTFTPYNGDRIKINGVIYAIPSAGISGLANTSVFLNGVAGQNLAGNTTYYVYAFNNSGTVTADFSTTGHATSAAAGNVGVEIKSGDDTRSLIGFIRTNASSQFADAAATRFVRSWFNSPKLTLKGGDVSNVATTSTTAVELGSGKRVEFLTWSGEGVWLGFGGSFDNSTSSQWIDTGIGVDVTNAIHSTDTLTFSVTGGLRQVFCSVYTSNALSEGYHYGAPVGLVSSNTGTWRSQWGQCLIHGFIGGPF